MRAPIGVRILLGVVILAVIGAVAYGIFLTGSPSQQRSVRSDQRRISDLQGISYAIDSYLQTNKQLPGNLDELRAPQYYVSSIKDPLTDEPYEYRVIGDTSYELCAVFQTDSSQQAAEFPRPFSETVWEHGKGRACFELQGRTVDSTPPPGGPVTPIPEQ